MILSKGVSTCIQASWAPAVCCHFSTEQVCVGWWSCDKLGTSTHPAAPLTLGLGSTGQLLRELGKQCQKKLWGMTFWWSRIVHVNHCQKTQMHLVDLALRFHRQKLQCETWVHTGAGNKSCYQQRHLNVSQCKAPQGSPPHFRDSCWPLLNMNQS